MWLREKNMICKEGKRASIGQFVLSFNYKQLICMINTYLLVKKYKKVIKTANILKMMEDTKNEKVENIIKEIKNYNDIYHWWEERNKNKENKILLKKGDIANIIYLLLKYFNNNNVDNKRWLIILS